jgi:aminoglycoside phosphotransferase (APT) family kinase protein
VTGFEPATSSSRTRSGISALSNPIAAQCNPIWRWYADQGTLRVCGLALGSRQQARSAGDNASALPHLAAGGTRCGSTLGVIAPFGGLNGVSLRVAAGKGPGVLTCRLLTFSLTAAFSQRSVAPGMRELGEDPAVGVLAVGRPGRRASAPDGRTERSQRLRPTRSSPRPDSGAGEPAVVVGSRVAVGHHAVTRSALDAARRPADSGAQGRRRPLAQGSVTDTRLSRRCAVVDGCGMASTPADGRAGITAGLVRRLLRSQFPQWGDLPVVPVEVDGWDNRTYRLGDDMAVRLPTAQRYVPAVAKENQWLPVLAPGLPVPVPSVLGAGAPGDGYPFPWSVRAWLPGEPAQHSLIADASQFAVSLAQFLLALWGCDPAGGPVAGEHSFCRGESPAHYDRDTRSYLAEVEGVESTRAAAVWDAALSAEWTGEPVWFHGDVAAGNLLVRDGVLSAVIDFGTSGVGDPACDLVIAWTLFSGGSREAFRQAVGQDGATWARARGWVLWKALLGLAASTGVDEERAAQERSLIAAVLDDHEQG